LSIASKAPNADPTGTGQGDPRTHVHKRSYPKERRPMGHLNREIQMKKHVLLFAMLAMSGIACAQSSVTVFGVVDATLQHGSGSISDRNQLGSGGLKSSRIGFLGVEDLGGGVSAGFWLEGAFFSDNGSGGTTSTNNQANGITGGGGLTFGRRATVSLFGGWGEVRLGRDYSVQYYNRMEFDPFANNGAGATQTNVGSLGGPVSSRASNAIMYFLPLTLGGVYGEAEYYLGENARDGSATENDGTGGGVRIGYKNGPVNVAFAQARTQYARTATTGAITSTNVAGSYRWKNLIATGGYYRDKVDTLAGLTGRGPMAGAIYLVGVGEIKAMWSSFRTSAATSPESKKISLGYVHNLSKRTALYGSYAHVRNEGGATTAINGSVTAPNHSSSGFDLGIRHNF
jgi:predicted porin